jgi:hypothetical protein
METAKYRHQIAIQTLIHHSGTETQRDSNLEIQESDSLVPRGKDVPVPLGDIAP